MQKFIMLAGPSGSGKSTYGEELREKLKGGSLTNAALVSSDDTREMLYGDASDQTDHQRVFDIVDADIKHHLTQGRTVIYDATNLQHRWRATSLNIALHARVPSELHYLTTIAEMCLRRQVERDRKVPPEVVLRQVAQRKEDLERPLQDFYYEGFKTIKFIST